MRVSWFYNLSAMGIRGAGLVAKFLLVLCLVRYFQPSELGLYGIVAAMVAYALFFLGMEFYNYTSRTLVGASPRDQVIIIRDQFILYALTFCALSPLFYLLFYHHVLPYSICFLFFILVIAEHVSNELMRVLIVLSRPYLANVVFFLRQGLWIIVLLPLFYFVPASREFSAVFIAWIAGALLSIVVAGVGLYQLPWRCMWQAPIQWLRLMHGLNVSRPFMISAFCALSMLYIERFFVNYYCGLDAVGIYTFYAGLSLTLHNLVNTGVSKMRLAHLLAAWKQHDMPQFQHESVRMLKDTTLFVLVFAALSVCLIYPFINLIGKSVYLSQVPIFYCLLFGAACRSIADVPLYTLYAQHNDRLLLSINFAAFCIMILGNALLVPRFGLMGAACSSAAASLALVSYALFTMIQRTFSPLARIEY